MRAKMLLFASLFFTAGFSKPPAQAQIPAPTPAAVEAPKPSPAPSTRQVPPSIMEIAGKSSCASYRWKDRGRAPVGYIKGIALVFARAVCNQSRQDVAIVSSARRLPEAEADLRDALSWYNSNFKSIGMANDQAGVDTLRHAYTLLIGLGMRESSGKYCCGRDMSADFSTSDSAEAGIFQTSWGARRSSQILVDLFDEYRAGKRGCLLEVFKEGFGSCSESNLKNWGTGTGVEWQRLTKACPAFSTEYAAVVIRKNGGSRGEFGPLRRKAAELRPECDDMLLKVQRVVEEFPEICRSL